MGLFLTIVFLISSKLTGALTLHLLLKLTKGNWSLDFVSEVSFF